MIDTELERAEGSPEWKKEVRKAALEALAFLNGKDRPHFNPQRDYYSFANPVSWLVTGLGALGLAVLGWRIYFFWLAHRRDRRMDQLVHQGEKVHSFRSIMDWQVEFDQQLNDDEYSGYEDLRKSIQEWADLLANSELEPQDFQCMQELAQSIFSDRKMRLGRSLLLRFRGNDRPHNRNMMFMVVELSLLTMQALNETRVAQAKSETFSYFKQQALKILFLKHILFSLKNLRENQGYNVSEHFLTNDPELNRLGKKIFRNEKAGWTVVRIFNLLNRAAIRHSGIVREQVLEYARVARALGEQINGEELGDLVNRVLSDNYYKKERRTSADDTSAMTIHRKLISRVLTLASIVVGLPALVSLGISFSYLGFASPLTALIVIANLGNFFNWTNFLGHIISNLSGAEERHYREAILRLGQLQADFDALRTNNGVELSADASSEIKTQDSEGSAPPADKKSPERSELRSFIQLARKGSLLAALIIFHGILPAGAEIHATKLMQYAPVILNQVFDADLKLKTTNVNLPVSPTKKVATVNTLYIEGGVLAEREILQNLDQLTKASFKIVILFGARQKNDFELFRQRLKSTHRGSLEIRYGSTSVEMVIHDVKSDVSQPDERRTQYAFAGKDKSMLRRLKPHIDNLITVDETFLPTDWLLQAFLSPAIFDLGGMKNQVWSLNMALPILLQGLAAQRIARSA